MALFQRICSDHNETTRDQKKDRLLESFPQITFSFVSGETVAITKFRKHPLFLLHPFWTLHYCTHMLTPSSCVLLTWLSPSR